MKLSVIPSSLTSRLILLGIVLLLTGALGRTVLLSDYLRDDLQKQTAEQLLAIANYVAQDIERDLADRQSLLERIAGNLGRVTSPAERYALLGQAQNLNPLFSQGMLLVDRDGRVSLDYPVLPGRSGSSLADRAYFKTALAGKASIGQPFIDAPATGAILPMAVPVHDANGLVTKVLVGYSALHSANFMAALYATRIGNSGGLLLVSPQHRLFIAASDEGKVLRRTPADGVNPMHDRAMRGFRGTGVTINAAGIEEIAATASVPSGDWFVVARLPTEEAFAPLERLRSFILKNTAIILPAFIVFMIIVMRSMLRPLMETARRADLMTLGEIPLATLPVARKDEVGHLTGAFNRMLSKLLESRAELAHMAHHDPLTGLPNRKLLADRMSQALARAQRNRTRIAILFLDLDGFKPINDRFGHEAGDQALVEVARRLGGMLRQEDTLARIGGDEFVILLSDLAENAERIVAKVAEKCLSIFEPDFVIGGENCRLSTSIGIALGDADGDQLLIAADQAMYRAKEQGRGRYRWA